MILLLPPQLANDANRQIAISAALHGIKNPVVVELPSDQGMRRFEITEGEQLPEAAPPSSDVAKPRAKP